jgi:hypothetical protein
VGLTYKDQVQKYLYSATATIITTNGMDVDIGDLIVVGLGTDSSTKSGVTIYDTIGNVYTTLATVVYGNSEMFVGYAVSTAASATTKIYGEYTAVACTKTIAAVTFTPDVNDTVTLTATATGGSADEATPWEADACTVADDDSVVQSFFVSNAGTAYQGHSIGGNAATALTQPASGASYFYYIYSGAAAGVIASVSSSRTGAYSCRALVFSSSAPAGGLSIPVAEHYYFAMREA